MHDDDYTAPSIASKGLENRQVSIENFKATIAFVTKNCRAFSVPSLT
jgi:hypothetical protein